MPKVEYHFYYYAFGSPMAGRTHAQDLYRFGFNGKENDNETYGTGNALDFGARIYDPRLGRWLSVDPLFRKYPSLSPYNFANNNPIAFIDIDGGDIIVSYTYTDPQNGQTTTHNVVTIHSDCIKQDLSLNGIIPDAMAGVIQNVNIEFSLPDICKLVDVLYEGPQDARVFSVGASVVVIAGFTVSFELISINDGKDKGKTYAYFTAGSGNGIGESVGPSCGDVDVYAEYEKDFDHTTFEGACVANITPLQTEVLNYTFTDGDVYVGISTRDIKYKATLINGVAPPKAGEKSAKMPMIMRAATNTYGLGSIPGLESATKTKQAEDSNFATYEEPGGARNKATSAAKHSINPENVRKSKK